jgi:hypothetical protein
MGMKRVVTCKHIAWLPENEQARMAADVVDWMCPNLLPVERQDTPGRLATRLLARIRKGQFGLQPVAYYHLLRLPPWRWLKGGRYCEPSCS